MRAAVWGRRIAVAEVRWCPDTRDPKALAGRERLQNWSAAGPSHLLASVRLFGPMSSATRKVFTVIQQEAEGTASGGRGVNVLVRIKHNTSYPHLSLSDVGLRARPATGELALLHFPRDGLATVCFVAHGNPVRYMSTWPGYSHRAEPQALNRSIGLSTSSLAPKGSTMYSKL